MSNGSDELVHLARLLRLSARTGRQIGDLRIGDRDCIAELARRIEQIADEIDALVSAPPADSEVYSKTMVNSQMAAEPRLC